MIIQTATGPLYYEIVGNGPLVVFASGWAMSAECWRPAVSILARKYRCLIYDARGTGRSQPFSPHANFDIEDNAEDLHSILAASGIFDAAMVGHEMGGLVAALCADKHPQDVSSLTVVSPRMNISDNDLKKLSVFTPASLGLRELATFPLIRNVVAWRFRSAPQPYRDRLFEDFADLNPRAAYESALSASGPEALARFERLVERGDRPFLIVCGGKDKKGMAVARRLFARVRAGRLATMSGSGYLPMLEYPVQFAKLLDNFITAALRKDLHSLTRV